MTRRLPNEFIPSTRDKIRKLENEENLIRRKKHVAAIKIQKTVRGWLTRNHMKKLRSSAVTIQKYWRGFKWRVIIAKLVEIRYKQMVDDYYNKMATKIQAMWRGYKVRQLFDYYKMKARLLSVMKTNEETMKNMEEFRKSVEETKIKELEKECEPWIHYMANKLHHFIRTKVQPGIYSNPNTMEYSDIEKFIASYSYQGFMTDLRKRRLVEAVRELINYPTVESTPCEPRITQKRCVAAMKARHTISKPCINSTRK